MNDKFEELFKAMYQFHKLRIGEMMPNVSGFLGDEQYCK